MKPSWLKRPKNVISVEGLSWGFKKLTWKPRLVSDSTVIRHCSLHLTLDDPTATTTGPHYHTCDTSLHWMLATVSCPGTVLLAPGAADVFQFCALMVLRQVVLGLSGFLFPLGFQCRATLWIRFGSMRSMWPSQLNRLFFISRMILWLFVFL